MFFNDTTSDVRKCTSAVRNHFLRPIYKRPEILTNQIIMTTNPGTFGLICRKVAFHFFSCPHGGRGKYFGGFFSCPHGGMGKYLVGFLRLVRPQLYVYFDLNFTSISASILRLLLPFSMLDNAVCDVRQRRPYRRRRKRRGGLGGQEPPPAFPTGSLLDFQIFEFSIFQIVGFLDFRTFDFLDFWNFQLLFFFFKFLKR